MSNIYMISDMHFGDENILRFEDRPFANVEELREAIIERWNKTCLSNQDITYVLGDVGIGSINELKWIIDRCHGYKRLIIGNHDTHYTISEWMSVGFEMVSPFPICIDNFYWLSHEPMYLNANMPYINIHGHIHNNLITSNGKINQYVNVCVEHLNYTPISFERIKERSINKIKVE